MYFYPFYFKNVFSLNFRVCYVGKTLMASELYDSCTRSDAKLRKYFMKMPSLVTHWNESLVFTVNGVPGLTSGALSGIFSFFAF